MKIVFKDEENECVTLRRKRAFMYIARRFIFSSSVEKKSSKTGVGKKKRKRKTEEQRGRLLKKACGALLDKRPCWCLFSTVSQRVA